MLITLCYSDHALHITGLDPESTAAVYPGDGFRRVKGFHISAWARAGYGNDSVSVGIVCKPIRLGSIIEVKRRAKF
jgi:hypothetical protein